MSRQSQIKNMKKLGELLSSDLGYIFGEKECGPNGAKKQFHSTGRAFLWALGNDLGFTEQKVKSNHAGIAVSGEVTLMGMWSRSNGLYVRLEQDLMGKFCILYRSIAHMKDYSGGRNNYIYLSEMRIGDYDALLSQFLSLKEAGDDRRAA